MLSRRGKPPNLKERMILLELKKKLEREATSLDSAIEFLRIVNKKDYWNSNQREYIRELIETYSKPYKEKEK